ncbi:MAG: hypothetical protein K6F75_00090 [Butyrivibrio sp.]|nr:hypothetical protein [Butyrivibrio sp.]
MFSKELQMMDRNNVIYMMDEYEAKVENLTEKNEELTTANEELTTENAELRDALKKYKEKFGDI